MNQVNKGDIGRMGEKTVAGYLTRNGHRVLDTNYRKPWGELDIVTMKEGIIHFIEVKTVSRDLDLVDQAGYAGGYEAAENVHPWKMRRLSRIILTYLEDRWGYGKREPDWQFDVAIVLLDVLKRKARIELLEDVELV